MGGKYGSKRHPGRVYITGLTTLLFFILSGCAVNPVGPSASNSAEAYIQQYLASLQELLEADKFQKALMLNRTFLNTHDKESSTINRRTAVDIRHAKNDRVLLHQIIKYRAQTDALSDRIRQDRRRQEKTEQTVKALKSRIKVLNTELTSLKDKNDQLEKQLERMKQIDLK